MKTDFDLRIKGLVDEYWLKYQKALHLSTLGAALQKQFDLNKETNGTKLSDYIRVALKDSIRLIQNPADRLVWALLPTSAAVPSSDKTAALFEIPAEAATPTGMVDKKLWAAFSVPLTAGNRRWVHFEPTVGFVDLQEQVSAGPNQYEVPRNLIIPAGDTAPIDRSAQLSRNIKQWVTQNSIVANITRERKLSGKNLLDLVVNSLSAEQLSQTTMRLDVIKRLMDTPAKQ